MQEAKLRIITVYGFSNEYEYEVMLFKFRFNHELAESLELKRLYRSEDDSKSTIDFELKVAERRSI